MDSIEKAYWARLKAAMENERDTLYEAWYDVQSIIEEASEPMTPRELRHMAERLDSLMVCIRHCVSDILDYEEN